MKLMDQIRAAIGPAHERIEQTAYSKALMSDYINPKDYARGIAQLWYIHQAIEQSIEQDPTLSGFFSAEMVRTATIVKDLDALAFGLESFDCLPETAQIVATIKKWAESSSFSILGCVYVLEGSRMGSLVIARFLTKALGNVPGSNVGIEYHTEGAASTPIRVRAFKDKIDSAGLSSEQADAMLLGSVEFMNRLNDLYDALPVASRSSSVHLDRPIQISQSA